MEWDDIIKLKSLVSVTGRVYWRDGKDQLNKIVDISEIDFEPVAMLSGGKHAALFNCENTDFYLVTAESVF